MIVITGASGFIGQHLVSMLRQQLPSKRLRAFDANPPANPAVQDVEVVRGRIDAPGELPQLVAGAEVVIHLAAKVEPDARDSAELRRVNVDGSRNLYDAAVTSECRLFVHMSSAGVYGHPRTRRPFREDDLPEPATPYQRTKLEAEEALREIDPRSTTLNILRPAGVYGPGSVKEIPQYRRVLRQRFALELRGGVVVHPTYVADVAEAIMALVATPAPHGSVFNIGGEQSLRLQDLDALVAELLDVERRRVVIPESLAAPASAIAAPLLARAGRPKPLLEPMSRGELFSAAVDDRLFRVRYPHVPVTRLREGLQRTLEWAAVHRLL